MVLSFHVLVAMWCLAVVSMSPSNIFHIDFYYITMVDLKNFQYGASDKATFMFCSDKLGITLLPCLVIDLKTNSKSTPLLKLKLKVIINQHLY